MEAWPGLGVLGYAVSPRKLEHGFRMILTDSAGIPYTLL